MVPCRLLGGERQFRDSGVRQAKLNQSVRGRGVAVTKADENAQRSQPKKRLVLSQLIFISSMGRVNANGTSQPPASATSHTSRTHPINPYCKSSCHELLPYWWRWTCLGYVALHVALRYEVRQQSCSFGYFIPAWLPTQLKVRVPQTAYSSALRKTRHGSGGRYLPRKEVEELSTSRASTSSKTNKS